MTFLWIVQRENETKQCIEEKKGEGKVKCILQGRSATELSICPRMRTDQKRED